MQTYSGKKFFPNDPPRSEFDIEDIAHALSYLNRFGGHTRFPYSVAQHSVLVAAIVETLGGTQEEILLGLMHDATEAYIVDVPTPVKRLISGYKDLETIVYTHLSRQLKLPDLLPYGDEFPGIVKKADGMALVSEAIALVTGDISDWPAFKEFGFFSTPIIPMSPLEAEFRFLQKWKELTPLTSV